jgi:hypothetical protein
VYPRLASNFHSFCLILSGAGIPGVHHPHPALSSYFQGPMWADFSLRNKAGLFTRSRQTCCTPAVRFCCSQKLLFPPCHPTLPSVNPTMHQGKQKDGFYTKEALTCHLYFSEYGTKATWNGISCVFIDYLESKFLSEFLEIRFLGSPKFEVLASDKCSMTLPLNPRLHRTLSDSFNCCAALFQSHWILNYELPTGFLVCRSFLSVKVVGIFCFGIMLNVTLNLLLCLTNFRCPNNSSQVIMNYKKELCCLYSFPSRFICPLNNQLRCFSLKIVFDY